MGKRTKTIAVAGKGGTGKTTIASLLIKLLSEKGTVLAIDADPATNLNLSLGLPLEETVGGVREEMATAIKKGKMSPGVPKRDWLELRISQALVESPKIDLLAMGRPEGPGCYCAANDMLRAAIDRLAANYDYVVIDCEAGMEHLSRQTTRDVDVLLLTSDPSMKGVITAARMRDLIGELRSSVGRVSLVINRLGNGLPPRLARAVEDYGLEVIAAIPEDQRLLELDATGAPIDELPSDSPLRLAVAEIAKKLGL